MSPRPVIPRELKALCSFNAMAHEGEDTGLHLHITLQESTRPTLCYSVPLKQPCTTHATNWSPKLKSRPLHLWMLASPVLGKESDHKKTLFALAYFACLHFLVC